MQKYALLIFFGRNIMGFLRPKYFFRKILFLPFPMRYSCYFFPILRAGGTLQILQSDWFRERTVLPANPIVRRGWSSFLVEKTLARRT